MVPLLPSALAFAPQQNTAIFPVQLWRNDCKAILFNANVNANVIPNKSYKRAPITVMQIISTAAEVEKRRQEQNFASNFGNGALSALTNLAEMASSNGATNLLMTAKSRNAPVYNLKMLTKYPTASTDGSTETVDPSVLGNGKYSSAYSTTTSGKIRPGKTDERLVISALARLEQDSKLSIYILSNSFGVYKNSFNRAFSSTCQTHH